jgi:hypothetical protein
MRKPDLIRAIYSELRRNLGPDVPAGDALRLAHFIVRSYTEERDSLADFGEAKVGRSLLYAPVDEAMNDGGWRVMEYECSSAGGGDDLNAVERLVLCSLIEKYLGPEWQHHQWIGPL